MDYRINVFWRAVLPNGQAIVDGRAAALLTQIAHLGIDRVTGLQVSDLYFIRGTLTEAELNRLAAELLCDPVVEGYALQPPDVQPPPGVAVIEVGLHPGVTDPVAGHLLRRAQLLGLKVEAAATAKRYLVEGPLSVEDLHQIAQELLCNAVIQHYALGPLQPVFLPQALPSAQIESIPIRTLDDPALARLSVERVLFLSLDEMRAVQAEFRRLGRDPTDVELETLAQTWSEHCQHKAFKSRIEFICRDAVRVLPNGEVVPAQSEQIEGLLRTYLRAATERLNKPWVRSAFVDNAGIIDFAPGWEVSFKVETHNHPSALEPFGGANTGVGGVIRDILGVSARPIANTDVLCFGPLDLPRSQVLQGSLHPRRIARGVVDGVQDYGNKMGIPTLSGALLYDSGYAANPLVYCGCVGLAPTGVHRNQARPGDLCVALGGRTGRDGIHGATFSSAELTHETGTTVGAVVQIGDPITEKAVQEAIIQARDEGLYSAITDCGAGGFSSAVGEMGKRIGVEVELADVRLKYPGLRPWEIWLSEAQERMVLAVPPENLERLKKICDALDVEWTVIGRFTDDRRLRVYYAGRLAADLDMDFLHDGWPQPRLKAEWQPVVEAFTVGGEALRDLSTVQPPDYPAILLRMLAHPDVASKEAVIRQYDHEVQGGTLIKPLVGAENDGPSDAAVIKPLAVAGWRGLALGVGISPHYGRLDPYAMAWAVIDEALRNVVAVGADPDRVALLDNFCWGNPALPDRLGSLVRAAQGCYDAALAYGVPFISGKDSLNNEYVDAQGAKRAIPPTLLISSLGIVPDVRRCVTMDFKQAGNLVYIIGQTRDELGASLYNRLIGHTGGVPPQPVSDAVQSMRALYRAIDNGLVRACHDLSEGGLAVAAAEMAFAGRTGVELDLRALPRPAAIGTLAALFSESSARFLLEVRPADAAALEQILNGRPVACLGRVTDNGRVRIIGLDGCTAIDLTIDELLRAWQSAELM